jgi:glycosyltransferase involved in cell wall biosynthesis
MGRYARLRNFKYMLYPFFLERMVEAAARQIQFDLLHSQHAIAAVSAGRLRVRLRVPVVMNFLDYLSGFMETWPGYVMPKPVLQRIMNFELSLPNRYQADGVLTVSDTLAEHFAEKGYPKGRLRPIYYGYDAELFKMPQSSGPGGAPGPRPGSGPVLVMHGSFDQHHLGAIAREAVAIVAAQRPEAVFRFVGQRTPALRAFVEGVQRELPAAKIECTGFLPYREVAGQLADATVGLVPYEESQGTHCAFVAKIVEYLAMGLPVVSTPLRSASQYFANEPRVRFSGFDGASFGAKILSWLNESPEQNRALAAAAAQRVRNELDWRRISKNAIDFVETVQQKAPDAKLEAPGSLRSALFTFCL